MMQGMLDDSMSVYATTAANAFESSWGTYCPGMVPGPGPEFSTCLGDLYSVAFLENRCAPPGQAVSCHRLCSAACSAVLRSSAASSHPCRATLSRNHTCSWAYSPKRVQ